VISGSGSIHLGDATRNLVVHNKVLGNGAGGWGIELWDSSNNLIAHNVSTNHALGVLVMNSSNNLIAQNVLAHNDAGVQVVTLQDPHSPPAFSDNNELRDNRARYNTLYGIGVAADDVHGTLIVGNRANGNGGDGVQVLNATTTVTRNTANQNGDFGIEAVPGVIDGGGNRAFGNGNPLQCLNVVCK
jgi:parallel beta-helix repeat protein